MFRGISPINRKTPLYIPTSGKKANTMMPINQVGTKRYQEIGTMQDTDPEFGSVIRSGAYNPIVTDRTLDNYQKLYQPFQNNPRFESQDPLYQMMRERKSRSPHCIRGMQGYDEPRMGYKPWDEYPQ